MFNRFAGPLRHSRNSRAPYWRKWSSRRLMISTQPDIHRSRRPARRGVALLDGAGASVAVEGVVNGEEPVAIRLSAEDIGKAGLAFEWAAISSTAREGVPAENEDEILRADEGVRVDRQVAAELDEPL